MKKTSEKHQVGSKKFIQAVCVLVSTAVFLTHSYINVKAMLENPTTLTYTLQQETPSLPALTICPPGGLQPTFLAKIGLNLTCETIIDCHDNYMKLKGVDFDTHPLEEIWFQGIIPLEKLVSHVQLTGVQISRDSPLWSEMWSISDTIFGPCWTLKPPRGNPIELSSTLDVSVVPQIPCSIAERNQMQIGPNSVYNLCEEVANFCNTSCIEEKYAHTRATLLKLNNFIYILHNRDQPPTIGDKKAIAVIDDTDLRRRVSIQFKLKQTNERLLSPSKHCSSDKNYSTNVCESICLEREISRGLNCTPYSIYTDNHYTTGEFCKNTLFALRSRYITSQFNHDDMKLKKCKTDCIPQCSQEKYDIEIKTGSLPTVTVRPIHHEVSVKFTVPYVETIVEERLYTISSLTASIGGSLGLNVGAGIITVWLGVHLCIKKPNSILSSKPNTKNIIKQESKSFVTIWKLSGYLFCALLFCVHSLQLFVDYSKYAVASTIEMGTMNPHFPLITICPDMPFHLSFPTFNVSVAHHELIQNNVCDEYKHCHRQDVVKYIVANLPGTWNQSATVEEFWETSKRPISSIVQSFVFGSDLSSNIWKPTLTSAGYCISLDGKTSPDSNELILFFNNEDPLSEIDLEFENTILEASVFILATPLSVPPLFIGSTKETLRYRIANEEILFMSRTRISRTSTPKRCCAPSPYNLPLCKHQCILQVATSLLNCTLPSYHPDPGVGICQTQDHYSEFPKGGVLDVLPEIMHSHLELVDECHLNCPNECETETIHVIPSRVSYSFTSDLKLTYNPGEERHISETLLIPLRKLLLEFCGILGLYFEWSVVDVIVFLVVAIFSAAERLKVNSVRFHQTLTRFGRIGFVSLRFSAAAFFFTLFLNALQQHISSVSTHTQYAKALTLAHNVPAATVCSFPPFNFTRLIEIGITFDTEMFCFLGMFFLDCPDKQLKEYLLNFGDGLGELSVEEVWKQTSWDLADIVHSYEVEGHVIRIGNSSVDAIYWSPRRTAMGQCFTFQLPTDSQNTTVRFFLQKKIGRFVDDLYYPYPLEGVVELIEGTATDKYVLFHSKIEQPLFPFGDKHVEVHKMTNRVLTFEFSLTRYRSLPLKGRCLDNVTYSQRRCLEDCVLKQASLDFSCKMPFLHNHDLPLPPCNESQYLNFPKYRVNLVELDFYQRHKSSCLKRCKPGCYLDLTSYKLTGEDRFTESQPYSTAVELKPAEDFHELFEEVQLTSWAMFISDMGGLASALLGVSLFSLLKAFLTAVDVLWQVMVNRVGVMGH